MKLVEVHMIGPQPLERFLQFRSGTILRSPFGLAGEKDIFAIRLQGGPKFDLRVPVARRDIEIVDALFNRLRDEPIGMLLLDAADHHPAEANDRQSLARVPVRPLRQLGRLPQ